MIAPNKDPVSFTDFLYQLTEAKEHLGNLIAEIPKDHAFCEEALRVDLGHIFAHLNRAWHGRDAKDDAIKPDWDDISKFPTDLEPVG